MPLVDLDDPEELRARWSALAAVAHATGFDRRWYADGDGWYHQDETGSDLRMVRLDGGRSVLELEYHSHPSASDVVAEVVESLASKYPGVHGIAVSHRVGPLKIGDVALACAVAAEHRGEAFSLCSDLVDEVKARLPVWKRQVFSDGKDEWVNCP